MGRSLLIVVLILMVAATVFAKTSTYEIREGGKKICDCVIEMEKRGAGYYIQKNVSVTDASGTRNIIEEIVVGGGWLPEDYKLDVQGPETDVSLTADFTDKGVLISGKLGMGEVTKTLETASDVSIWSDQICMTSALLLLPRVDYTMIGQLNEFSVVLPEKTEMGIVTLSITSKEGDVYVVHGKVPGGWEFDAWFDPQTNFISKYTVKGGYEAVVAEMADESIMEELPKGYNPLPIMLLGDRNYLDRLHDAKNLTAGISMSYPKEAVSRLYLNRFSQEFAGEITATTIAGNVENKKMGHKVTNTPDWPLYYSLRGVEEVYSMPERGIDSDYAPIKERAEKTVEPALTLWDAARAINLWVYRNIEFAHVIGGAKETFENKKGDSRAKALLCVAMCRSVGIPARIVSGILYADGPSDHTWVEVYLGEEAGWGPIDPTLGEADKINAAHISLWLGSQMPPVFAKDIILEEVEIDY